MASARWKLGLPQEDFARRIGIPLDTLRDWERHRAEPDQAAERHLKDITHDPKAAAEAIDVAG